MTTTADLLLDEAIQTATHAWKTFGGPAYGALLGDWATSANQDGQPIITAHIHGQHATATLHRFADTHRSATRPGDQHPCLAYTASGIEVSWRDRGVWIRLLAP